MEIKELFDFIDLEDCRLIEHFHENSTQKEKILARTVKLAEELGELCNEVLAYNGYQRKDKLAYHNRSRLLDEFADVVITILLLAKSMDIDVVKALKRKIARINKRYE